MLRFLHNDSLLWLAVQFELKLALLVLTLEFSVFIFIFTAQRGLGFYSFISTVLTV